MRRVYIVLAAITIMMAAGCSTSMITSSWKLPEATPKNYKKILVLGLIGEPDRIVREKMEQHIAADLRDLGYNASCACESYSPKAFEGLSEKEAVQFIGQEGYDAVLTVVLLDKEKERYYTPGRVYYSPYSIHQRRFWPYYSTMYGRVYEPGYYSVETKYFWETNLYDLTDWNLVYSAQSQSFDPGSVKSMAHEYGLMIIKDMVKQKVLQQQPVPALKSF
jgi:hypothetical protein